LNGSLPLGIAAGGQVTYLAKRGKKAALTAVSVG
jgi:hypothetical protein